MRTLAWLLVVLGTLPLAVADDDAPMRNAAPQIEAPEGWLDLSSATVLASPGTPEALWTHLPGAARPARLTWPLPAGPLLLLGLPETDEAALDVATALGLLEHPSELAGGYAIFAWQDGDRAVAAILGADAAALFAARFELEPAARPEQIDPNMRGVELARPDAEASVWMREGVRRDVPRYAVRALLPVTPDFEVADVIDAAGARANALWLDPDVLPASRLETLREAAARYGLATRVRKGAARTYREASTRFPEPAEGLRVDAWAAPFQGFDDYAPTLPPDLDDESGGPGVLIVGHRGTRALLEAAWRPGPIQDAVAPLAAAFPLTPTSGRNALAHAAARIETLHRPPRWLRAFGARYREILAGKAPVVAVPLVPELVVDDDRLTDPAWAHAARLPLRDGEVLVVADGRRLVVGVRRRGRAEPPLVLLIRELPSTPTTHVEVLLSAEPGPKAGPQDTRTVEVPIDRFNGPRGDAHAGQVLWLRVVAGEGNTWPPDPGQAGVLVVVP